MYGIAISELNRNPTLGSRIYQQPLHSAEEVDTLKKQLIDGDGAIERKPFYFPHLHQAIKVQNTCLRVLILIKNFFLDLVTFPSRVYTYGQYKNQLKQNLPIYQYLRNHNVPQKYLDQDRFAVFLFSGEKDAAPFVREGGIPRKIMGDQYDPAVFKDRNYQEYQQYQMDVYYGLQRTGSGLALLTEETKTSLSQPFVIS